MNSHWNLLTFILASGQQDRVEDSTAQVQTTWSKQHGMGRKTPQCFIIREKPRGPGHPFGVDFSRPSLLTKDVRDSSSTLADFLTEVATDILKHIFNLIFLTHTSLHTPPLPQSNYNLVLFWPNTISAASWKAVLDNSRDLSVVLKR